MLQYIKQVIETLTLRKKIEASMGLKFVVALAAVISILMVLGTLFVARMLVEAQYRTMEIRGRELGLFLGKAGAELLILRDVIGLDGLVADATRAKDMQYIYIVDQSNQVMNNKEASFNRADPEVAALVDAEPSADLAALAARMREKTAVLPVEVPVTMNSTRIGTVIMGFSRESVKRQARGIVWLLLATSAVIVTALSLVVFWMARRMIVLPTRESVAIASGIANGDLTRTVHVHSVDELGMLGRGLNRMVIGLKAMIEKIRAAARSMDAVWGEVKKTSAEIGSGSRVQSESVEEAASSVNEMHYALKEIAGNVDDLASTSERTSSSVIELAASVSEVAKTMGELSGSIETTSTAITQMSLAIREIAENVETLSSAAEQTSSTSTEISASVKEVEQAARESVALAEAVAADAQNLGMRAIAKTIEGMGRIESNTKHTAEIINSLGGRAENIGSILTVIEDITDQTGLLALNAAILAAQAGEHGKGFAVVAAAIRELAQRTAASTQEIGTLISAVQAETRQAVDAMREGEGIVQEGVRLASDAGEALTKIVERAGSSRDMSRSISRAAAEQTRGIKQVSEAIQQINSMAHQFERAAKEQKAGSEQIMRAAEKMRDITRFVKNSTEEQAKAGKEITAAVEQMSAKVGMVNRATEEVRSGSDLIVKAIDRIKEIARSNVDLAGGLNSAMDVVSRQSDALTQELDRFRTEAVDRERP